MSDTATFMVGLAPLIFGLVVGTLANFGLQIDRGQAVPPHKVVAHMMILGLCGLIAWAGAESAHLSMHLRALTGAAAGLLGAKLARRFADFSDREAERRLPTEKGDPQ